jgi:hypothetical protein
MKQTLSSPRWAALALAVAAAAVSAQTLSPPVPGVVPGQGPG